MKFSLTFIPIENSWFSVISIVFCWKQIFQKRNVFSVIAGRYILQKSNVNDTELTLTLTYITYNAMHDDQSLICTIFNSHVLIPYPSLSSHSQMAVILNWNHFVPLMLQKIELHNNQDKADIKVGAFFRISLLRRNVYGMICLVSIMFLFILLLLLPPLTHWSEFSNFIRLA